MSFLPLENPIGFGASDFIELFVAAMLVLLTLLWRPLILPFLLKLSTRSVVSMLFLALLPVALRLLLLQHHPVPTPDVYDEFSHLLVADTLRHFRLANPPHPLHQFFETFFVLQDPTYSSIYPIGQGIALAIGRALLGHPWAGVLLSTAAFCSLSYWMLLGWTTPPWALAGGVLAVIEFGPLNPWMNSYWGGAFAAAAGSLVFGSIPRLKDTGRLKYAALLGLGLGLSLLTRPYESIFLTLSVILFTAPSWRKPNLRAITLAIVATLPATGVMLLQDKRVTGKWLTLPYALSQYQYGVPASLTFQPNPVPHRDLTPQQEMEYRSQMAFRDGDRETLKAYLLRLEYRVRFYRFFFLPSLFVALPFFLLGFREYRFMWLLLSLLAFALGINFFPAFQLHYLASITSILVLISIRSLERLNSLGRGGAEAAQFITFLCLIHFVFWGSLHLFDNRGFSQEMRQYETWDGLNHQNPQRRIFVNHQLASLPGKLLVFVRYSPRHIFQDEWVYNEADIDRARIIWARDLGPRQNDELRAYYPDRAALLLEPDVGPPRLTPYDPIN